jgi:hypothetical protein
MKRGTAVSSTELTLEERRERRRLRREKQREDNVRRAAKMHVARLRMDKQGSIHPPELKRSIFVGCSGWRYWKWRDTFYAGVPQNDWFMLHINVLGLASIADDVTPELARASIASVSVRGALHASPAVKAALSDRMR